MSVLLFVLIAAVVIALLALFTKWAMHDAEQTGRQMGQAINRRIDASVNRQLAEAFSHLNDTDSE